MGHLCRCPLTYQVLVSPSGVQVRDASVYIAELESLGHRPSESEFIISLAL